MTDPIEDGLISVDGALAYPLSQGIFFLMDHAAIALTPVTEAIPPDSAEAGTRDAVRDFYDATGWKKVEAGGYEDSNRFEDLRPVARDYVHKCHLRVNRYLPTRGRYLLDVASGPLQYSEYLTYSEGFEYRICADVSLTALVDARKKLGDRGVYVLCDVTNLPFVSGSIDGVVSLHTIYHVAASEQARAFRELRRVLTPGAVAVVVYSWGEHWPVRRFMRWPIALARKLLRGTAQPDRPGASGDALYFQPHDGKWIAREVMSLGPCELVCWRSTTVSFMKTFLHGQFFGRQILALLYWMEDRWPHIFGRIGAYPMLVLRK